MQLQAKKAAGKKASEWIESGMIVGLGSGTSASCFIESLIERCQQGLKIHAVASSRASSEMARKGGISVLDINEVGKIDLTVDGADEIDPQKRMIKGGGGAHVREKILAHSSQEMVVVIDATKQVPVLGTHPLPIEVLFFGAPITRAKVESCGYASRWRMQPDGSFFLTENGNLLLDLFFPAPILNPEELDAFLRPIPGVVDTGFFFGLAGRVIVGHPTGETQVY